MKPVLALFVDDDGNMKWKMVEGAKISAKKLTRAAVMLADVIDDREWEEVEYKKDGVP